MQTTNERTRTINIAAALELNVIGEAIFAEWYPDRRPGDPGPSLPPLHLMQEARDLALRHRLVAARRRDHRLR